MKKRACGIMACFGLLMGAIIWVGCEDTNMTNSGIIVTADRTSLNTTDSADLSVVLTASASGGASTNAAAGTTIGVVLYLPLVWSVSNPGLGAITGQGGMTAVYTRTNAKGSNVIVVRDQAEAEGVIAITQF